MLVIFTCVACAMFTCWQEVKHLEYVTRHDLVFPTGFPGGLTGFVKKLFLAYDEQFGGSSDDEPMQPQQPEAGVGYMYWSGLVCLTLVFCL